MSERTHIAIIGAGPSGLFMFKKLLETGADRWQVDIFEKNDTLGAGMPYSKWGALDEHITNVSANEIPKLETTLEEWVTTLDSGTLKRFGINAANFNEYKVLPRLLFGEYLSAQFRLLKHRAREVGMSVNVYFGREVLDIRDVADQNKVAVTAGAETREYDRVIICTGHQWPLKLEKTIPGYFDCPYPPSKIAFRANYSVAIKGASLTAIDAVRTLARNNGSFQENSLGELTFLRHDDSSNFRLVMHSLDGMLPAVRFHLDDSTLGKDTVLSREEVEANRAKNDGFLSLDYVFERNFKDLLRDKHPEFYERIRDMQMEEFVSLMMSLRENKDGFVLLKQEYEAAEKSIREHKSIHWKELLAVLSFAMNYPAKYFSAEDRLRLQRSLMPLISLVIAFVPQTSVREMLALHEAGVLSLVPVGKESYVEALEEGGVIYHYQGHNGKTHAEYYQMYINCTGQPHLSFEEFPYASLQRERIVSPARLKYRDQRIGQEAYEKQEPNVIKDADGEYYLRVPGIAINDHFQVVNDYNALNERIYIMAVPYIGGFNPDYSGLDFCEAASTAIINRIAG